jgi:uncharacterized protein with PIN domain
MNLMDENIIDSQRERLRKWRIPFRHIGYDEARKGIQDDEIASLLRHRRNVTLFSRDQDFYRRRLCHPKCCFVFLDVSKEQAAEYIRKFLRHSEFRTQAQRMGCVIRVSHNEMHLWRLNSEAEETVNW